MIGKTLSPMPDWKPILRTGLLATMLALVVMLSVSAILMAATLGGFVIIILVVMDALRLATIILRGFILVVPITLVLLPALTLLCHQWPRLLRWILLLAGPMAGGWWGLAAASWWFGESRAIDGFLATLGMIGGLTAGIVFARRVPRHLERLVITGS
jgi:hypothetical protein